MRGETETIGAEESVAMPGISARECLATAPIGAAMIRRACLATATLMSALAAALAAAQEPLRIRVAPTIVAAAGSQATLPIVVDPPDAVPAMSFLNLRGVPPTVSLTDAHAINASSWAVPLASLSGLRVVIPDGISGQSEITISLIAMDGRLLVQTKTMLVIQGSLGNPTAERMPGRVPAAVPGVRVPFPSERSERLSPEDRQRALAFIKKGDESLAAGNVSAARLFYERAADVGLAEGALAVATTFDPDELARQKVLGGLQPDPAAARRWYERAREMGAAEAESRIRRLATHGR
jgi:hypothetical protein